MVMYFPKKSESRDIYLVCLPLLVYMVYLKYCIYTVQQFSNKNSGYGNCT